MGLARGILRTMRPHQWVKNVFVLAPVVFAKELFDYELLLHAGGAFVVFCLLAGAVYTVNDIVDAPADRIHPVKRHRPIASGVVPIGTAKVLAVTLLVLGMAGALYGPPLFWSWSPSPEWPSQSTQTFPERALRSRYVA